MFTIKNFAAPLAALALPVLLATSVLAKPAKMNDPKKATKMTASKMNVSKPMGSKTGGSKTSLAGLVPVSGAMPSKTALMGAKITGTKMMHGMKITTVHLKSGKNVMMCSAADKMKMGAHTTMTSAKSRKLAGGGKMLKNTRMSGKM